MDIVQQVDIDAPVADVWRIMADVTRWPAWTSSITSVELLDTDGLAVGARARIRQPRLPSAVWSVTALEPEASFEWRARTPGLTSTAMHRIDALPDARSRVTLALGWRGPLAPVIRLLYGTLARRYVQLGAWSQTGGGDSGHTLTLRSVPPRGSPREVNVAPDRRSTPSSRRSRAAGPR